MSTTLRRVAIYCGARLGNSPLYAHAAAHLAQALSNANIGIVYGGSKNGLMNIIANTALAAGNEVIGVMPRSTHLKEQAHPNLSELIWVEDMHARKGKILELADAVIAFPGGLGTLDELAEAFGWASMNLHHKPCLCFDVNQFWQPLFDLLAHMHQEGFMRNNTTLLRADCPQSAIKQLENALTYA